jgi:HK97 family phage major capsid protein
MTTTLEAEQILQKITEVNNAVINNKGVVGLDYDALTAAFVKALQQVDEARAKDVVDNSAVHMGEQYVAPTVEKAVSGYRGRYEKTLQDIVKLGYHQEWGTGKITGQDLMIAELLMDGAVKGGVPEAKAPAGDLRAAVKALATGATGTGAELTQTGIATSLWQDFYMSSKLVSGLTVTPMSDDPFDIPLAFGDFTWYKGTQSAATTSTDLATSESTLTSTEQVAEVDWSYSLDEDSVIALMPAIRARLTISGGKSQDAFYMNADATSTGSSNVNAVEATPASNAYYLTAGQDGLRHKVIVDYTSSGSNHEGGALSDTTMGNMLALMGDYGTDIENLRLVPEINSYYKLLTLTNVATVDKYGPAATILKGELVRYRGIPVIPTNVFAKTNATGKTANSASNTLGSLYCYHNNMWTVGFPRTLMIETWRDVQKRQLIMVVSYRIAIGCFGTRASAQHTAGAFNFAV